MWDAKPCATARESGKPRRSGVHSHLTPLNNSLAGVSKSQTRHKATSRGMKLVLAIIVFLLLLGLAPAFVHAEAAGKVEPPARRTPPAIRRCQGGTA